MPTPITKQQLDAVIHERGLGSTPTVITSGCCEADSMTVAYFDGVLEVRCAKCDLHVLSVSVPSRLDS